MRIVMCAPEVVPFAKTGGLADVVGALPLALEKIGQEVIVVLPYYKEVSRTFGQRVSKISSDLYSLVIGKNIKVYFILQDRLYNRDNLYGDKHGDYPDNLERFSYYCQSVLKLLKKVNFAPDIIHCHDWQAALIPVYLKEFYKADSFYKNTKTVFTIHNLGYQGLFPAEEYSKLGLERKYFNAEGLEFFGRINLLKAGIAFSDIVTTVSPTYSKEIQTEELGFGLEGVLEKRKDSLYGILNGLDYSVWNPGTDNLITSKYSVHNLEEKSKNKEALQKFCGLPLIPELPLVGIVSRLAGQKGFDLLSGNIEAICKMDLQLVILGTGEAKYHHLLEAAAKKHKKTFSLHLKFDDELAHKIYAGSDIFLMPSEYEPCGLGQLIALKYASIPLVHKTGGLADTVNPQNGFLFDNYTKEALLDSLKAALKAYSDKARWNELMLNATSCDFSWDEAAKKYIHIYEKA